MWWPGGWEGRLEQVALASMRALGFFVPRMGGRETPAGGGLRALVLQATGPTERLQVI